MLYYSGTLDCKINIGPNIGSLIWPSYNWKIVVINNSELEQLFDVTIMYWYWATTLRELDPPLEYNNNFISAHETIVVASGTWAKGSGEYGGWPVQNWRCRLSGPTSSLVNFSATWRIDSCTYPDFYRTKYRVIVPVITNLTDRWQSIKVKCDTTNIVTYFPFSPGETRELKGDLSKSSIYKFMNDLYVNDLLWLEVLDVALLTRPPGISIEAVSKEHDVGWGSIPTPTPELFMGSPIATGPLDIAQDHSRPTIEVAWASIWPYILTANGFKTIYLFVGNHWYGILPGHRMIDNGYYGVSLTQACTLDYTGDLGRYLFNLQGGANSLSWKPEAAPDGEGEVKDLYAIYT